MIPSRPSLVFSLLLLALAGSWAAVRAAQVPAAVQPRAAQGPLVAPRWLAPAAELPGPRPAAGAVATSCRKQDCGNTGTLYGFGGNCTTALAALDLAITNAAYSICPDIVTGVDRHYGQCVEVGGQCRYDGHADVECKICPGMSCFVD